MNNIHIHDLLGYDNIKILQNDEMFSFSLDSMLLADFIDTKRAKRIMDLGTGNAPIPLFLTLKTDAKIYGVEIQKEVAALAIDSVKMNNLDDKIEIINKDFIGIYKELGANSFDIVCANPPYFKVNDTSIINKSDYLTIARHEVKSSIYDVAKEASKLLVDGGRLYIVHRTERLPEILTCLENNKFGIKKIRLIYPKINKDSYMFLLECRKNKKTDLRIVSPLYIHDESGKYTTEVLNIFNFKKEE